MHAAKQGFLAGAKRIYQHLSIEILCQAAAAVKIAVPEIAALVNRTPCRAKIASTVLLVASRPINSPTGKFFPSASLLGRPYWPILRPSILLITQAATAKMTEK